MYCKYKVYLDTEDTETIPVAGTANPTFDHSKHFCIHPVTQQFLQYLQTQALIVEVWGQQGGGGGAQSLHASLNTKELMNMEAEKAKNLINIIANPHVSCLGKPKFTLRMETLHNIITHLRVCIEWSLYNIMHC